MGGAPRSAAQTLEHLARRRRVGLRASLGPSEGGGSRQRRGPPFSAAGAPAKARPEPRHRTATKALVVRATVPDPGSARGQHRSSVQGDRGEASDRDRRRSQLLAGSPARSVTVSINAGSTWRGRPCTVSATIGPAEAAERLRGRRAWLRSEGTTDLAWTPAAAGCPKPPRSPADDHARETREVRGQGARHPRARERTGATAATSRSPSDLHRSRAGGGCLDRSDRRLAKAHGRDPHRTRGGSAGRLRRCRCAALGDDRRGGIMTRLGSWISRPP